MRSRIDHNYTDRSFKGNTLLMNMCELGYSEVALELIKDCEVDIGACNIDRDTALTIACEKKLYDVAYRLITTNRSNPGVFNANKKTALMILCSNSCSTSNSGLGMFIQMLEKFFTNLCLKRGEKSSVMKLRVFRALIATGESRPDFDAHGETALMLACRNNMPEEALMILASGESRPDFVRPDGTALTLACKNSMSKVAMKILSLTKHLLAKTWDEYYYTMAIRNAIKKSLYEVALAILDIGRINVDHVSEGKTLLDEAIATIGDNDEQMSLIVRLFFIDQS